MSAVKTSGMAASAARRAIAMAALSCAAAADARTLAWYRFEERSGGATTQGTVFTNTVDQSKYPAYPGVCAYSENSMYSKATLSYDSSHMPVYASAFPSSIALVDPNDTRMDYPNDGAVAINSGNADDKDNPAGAVFIDDHEDLRLQTGTIEFFVRIPATSQGFRCLATRIGRQYGGGNTSFNIYGKLLSSGDMYPVLEIAAVDGEPLRDQNGIVTNGVKYSANGNFSGVCLDNDRWHHIALTIDGASKKAILYVDYVRRASISYVGDILYEADCPFAFGAHPQCTYFGSSETIDEVRISDEVLSPDQMLGYGHRSSVSAGKDALLYFPFEGANAEMTFGADDMQEPVVCNPFLENRAVGGGYSKVSASFYRSSSAADDYDPAVGAGEVPAAEIRQCLRSPAANADLQSVHFATNGAGTGALRAVAVPASVSAKDLFGESCTVECFMKIPETGYLAAEGQSHLLCLYSAFQVKITCKGSQWNNGYVNFAVGGTSLLAANGKEHAKFIADGEWHHVAVVYDKENARAEAYVDYAPVASADSPEMNLGAHKSYYNGLMIGGSYWDGREFGNVWIDEVRVSRGALRPHQFLTMKAAEDDLLARASFEESLAMGPYTNFFGAAGEAMAFVAGASAPAYSPSRMARTFTEGRGGAVLVNGNRRSLEFDGGMVLWRDRALLADSDEFTVEFLLKSASPAAGAGIARVNRGSSSNVTAEVTWALSFADNAGRLALKVDTDAASGQTHVFDGASFADGDWHHVGLQFARSGSDTEVRLYRDAALVGSWGVSGRLATAPRLVSFMLGAGEDASVGFVGGIDELRVSPGVVDSGRFMTPVRKGAVVVIR